MANAHALVDTIVIDDPDAPDFTRPYREPGRRRVPTEELTMQVLVNGAFHRRIPTLSHTSCEQPIHSQFAPTRREELCHPLCKDGCFTPFELRLADERRAKEEDR